MPDFVYIIDRDGEPDVYADYNDAQEAYEILVANGGEDGQLLYRPSEALVFEASEASEITREWLNSLRDDYPPADDD